MEPLDLVVHKIKGLAKSGQEFVDGLLPRRENYTRRNPIEILKRLQREAFAEIMKLRDRQDRVERMLSFYNTSKRSPFQEANTHVRGEVDVLGAILLSGNVDQQHYDDLGRAGIRTGVDSRFTFETTVREKDTLLAELVASSKYGSEVPQSALSLAKVSYIANIRDWFSVIAVPKGAQFRDLGITGNSANQKKGLTDLSYAGPPLLNQCNGSIIGLTMRKSNVTASVAQSFSGFGVQQCSDGIGWCLNSFGQIVCPLPGGIKLTLSGVHQLPKLSSDHVKLGAFTVPVAFLKRQKAPETVIETNTLQTCSTGSIAMKVEKELDENTRIGGWIEMNNSNSRHLQWSVNLFDDSEDESGWGMCVSGMTNNWTHLQAESYLKLNVGNKFSVTPGIKYVVDGNARFSALMLRSNWFF